MELHPILELDTIANKDLWYVVSATGECPTMRVGHTCIQVGVTETSNGKLLVIAGANPSGPFNDVYVLDLDTFSWDTCDTTGFVARYEHATFVSNSEPNSVYVFAGANQAGNMNDVQVFNTALNKWTSVDVTGVPPSPRTHHTSASVGDQFIVYSGGQSGPDPVGDRQVHSFNSGTHSWSTLSISGDPPKPRHGHVMVTAGNCVFIHGGMAGTTFYDDLHVLDVHKKCWRSIKKKHTFPSARAAHAGISHGLEVYIFGGMGKDGALDDMFKLDTVTMVWTRIELQCPPPACRLDFAMCLVELKMAANPEQEGGADLMDASTKAKDTIEQQLSSINLGTPPLGSPSPSREGSANSQKKSPIPESHSPSNDDTTQESADVDVSQVELTKQKVPFCLIFGGMDTQGEIFDDCLVYRL